MRPTTHYPLVKTPYNQAIEGMTQGTLMKMASYIRQLSLLDMHTSKMTFVVQDMNLSLMFISCYRL